MKIITAVCFILILISTYAIQIRIGSWNLNNFRLIEKTENRIAEMKDFMKQQNPDYYLFKKFKQMFFLLRKSLKGQIYYHAMTKY